MDISEVFFLLLLVLIVTCHAGLRARRAHSKGPVQKASDSTLALVKTPMQNFTSSYSCLSDLRQFFLEWRHVEKNLEDLEDSYHQVLQGCILIPHHCLELRDGISFQRMRWPFRGWAVGFIMSLAALQMGSLAAVRKSTQMEDWTFQ